MLELIWLYFIVSIGTGFVKGGFGVGAGVLFTPILAMIIDPIQAVVIMSFFLLITDIDGMRRYYKEWDTSELKKILPLAVIGIIIGMILLPYISGDYLKIIIAIFSLVVVIIEMLKKIYPQKQSTKIQTDSKGSKKRLEYTLVALLTGILGYISGTAGLILSLYWLKIKNVRQRTATLLVSLTILDTIRMFLYFSQGYFTKPIMISLLLCVPFLMAGTFIGERVSKLLSNNASSTVFLGLIASASLLLLLF